MVTWFYVIGGVVVALLVFLIGYNLLLLSITHAQKQVALSNFDELHSNLEVVCLQEINNSMIFDLQVPTSVRVLFATDIERIENDIEEKIENGELSFGGKLCMQFRGEEFLRCEKLTCNVTIPYMGVVQEFRDIEIVVKKILGEAPVKDYKLFLRKVSGNEVRVELVE